MSAHLPAAATGPRPSENTSPGAAVRSAVTQVVIESAALFNGTSEIVIRHGDREYRLRRTRFDKLILTA